MRLIDTYLQKMPIDEEGGDFCLDSNDLTRELLEGPAQTVNLRHPVNGGDYNVTRNTYGALTDDLTNPLSAVSVANSSLSIDMWSGCTWQCGYCHVHDATVNHGAEVMKMDDSPKVRTMHSPRAIIEALVEHPFFIPGETVLSFGTASTEPFDPRVSDDVFELIDVLQEMGYDNPLWIVTKNGVPDRVLKRIEEVAKRSKNLMLSLTRGGLNKEIEPIQRGRFKNAGAAAKKGASVILYLRPLLEHWGSTPEKITEILEEAAEKIGDQQFAAIAPGGLRWAAGVEIALLSHGMTWPQEVSKDPDSKELPDHLYKHVLSECARLFPDVPVVKHSACALSNVMKVAEITAVYRRKFGECMESTCGASQRGRCFAANEVVGADSLIKKVNAELLNMGLPIFVRDFEPGGKPRFYPTGLELRYAVQRVALRTLARLTNL